MGGISRGNSLKEFLPFGKVVRFPQRLQIGVVEALELLGGIREIVGGAGALVVDVPGGAVLPCRVGIGIPGASSTLEFRNRLCA